MKDIDYAVVGTATTIKVFKFNEFPQPGVTTSVLNQNFDELYFGGMGWNVVCGLTKLGCSVYPMLAYSDSRFEPELRHWADEYRLDLGGVFRTPVGDYDYVTGYMFENARREHMTFGGLYLNGRSTARPEDLEYIQIRPDRAMLSRCRMLVLTVPKVGDVEPVLEAAEELRLPIAFGMRHDPRVFSDERLLWQTLTASKIVFANEEETDYILGAFSLGSVFDLMRQGRTEIYVRTLGKQGCEVYLRTREGAQAMHFVPTTDTPVGNVNAIGAGDGFMSGFLYGYARGLDPVTCAQYGSTVSSFVIERDGSVTNLPTPKEMLARNAARSDVEEN